VAGALFLLDIADTATVIGHVVLRSAAAASTFIALSAYPASAADLRLVAACQPGVVLVLLNAFCLYSWKAVS